MHIPKTDSNESYKLCLKKQSLDYFTAYDGLVDFIDKEISLTKKINYLRYAFKDGELASLLMDQLLQDKENARVRMKMDDNFVFLNEMSISLNIGENSTNPLKTIVHPNNFIELREKQFQNETHRLLRIDHRLTEIEMQQERLSRYATSYFEPKLRIANNTIMQETKRNTIKVIPREEMLALILE